jgi:outer membrane receptor for ferrienterochelin and colicins
MADGVICTPMKYTSGLFIGVLLFFCHCVPAQNRLACIVEDIETHERLANVSVSVEKLRVGGTTSSTGSIVISNIPSGQHKLSFSLVGYETKILSLLFPVADTTLVVSLTKAIEKTEEEVIVSSSRTESGIEDLPTKVEVLGVEEVNEEAGIKPGNIASLLGDVAGIQIQQTSAATGNLEMRVQGLPGKYTQLLRDGMPLFGGYAGSFSVLQIPPLDLKQIEIVKGASSTLYGGGAIAGMINLISRRPKEGMFEKTVLLNQSSLKESNVNLYLSNRKHKTGYTFFSGINYQKAIDVNKDGFSDVANTTGYFIHPTLFFYPDERNTVYIGYNGVFEKRKGGDMMVLNKRRDDQHQYFVANKSYRHTVDGNWENKLNAKDRLTVKGTASWFDRSLETNVFGMKAAQFSYYAEASYLKKWKSNDLVAGINVIGERFQKKQPDSSSLPNYDRATLGIFVQDDWRISPLFILQAGLRLDHPDQYGNFVLPRLSLLYRISHYFTTRLGGGLGYKLPTAFNSDIDERDYQQLVISQNGLLKAERSRGLNWDVNYHQKLNGWDLTANQTFFYNQIDHPILTSVDGGGLISFNNAIRPITTKGMETYVQVVHDALEIYLGYIYTSAKKLYDNTNNNLPLIAKTKFATVVSYEFSDHFRTGIELAYTGKQYLDDGSRTPGYLFAAAMMRYDYRMFSFVLNCENLLDYRQTRKENIVIPPFTNPGFRQLWAPIDGRVINFSVRIRI